jgi:hypothetical protein
MTHLSHLLTLFFTVHLYISNKKVLVYRNLYI